MRKFILSTVAVLALAGAAHAQTDPTDLKSYSDDNLRGLGVDVHPPVAGKPCNLKVIVDSDDLRENLSLLTDYQIIGNKYSVAWYQNHLTTVAYAVSMKVMLVQVKKLFDRDSSVKSCNFQVLFSTTDDYGQDVDKELLVFTFDRTIYNKVNWDKIEPLNLAKVSHNFTLSSWGMESISDEKLRHTDD